MSAPFDPAAPELAPDLLAQFRQVLLARRRFILLVTLSALLLAIFYLRTTDYLYEAQLRVAAAPGSASRAPRLGSLSGLAALAGVGVEAEATPFRLYLEDLTSPLTAAELAEDKALMQRIFAEEWTGSGWAPKASLADRAQALLLTLSGSPVEAATPPDAARLQQWLAQNIAVYEEQRSPVVILALRHKDPGFARSLLERLHNVADSRARARAMARAEGNIAHLDQRLAETAPLDLRQAIYATRAAEEQRLMLARNPTPFATQRFGNATATDQPVTPRQGRTLLLALVLGLVLGSLLALLRGPLAR
jgi:uncharacterized protein involved in exopolysaccharide biosynthesis